jgi:hypothetical protein
MKESDKWLRGLLGLAGTLLSAWAYVEARKALAQNWRQNDQLGVFGSAIAVSAAQTGCVLSLKELFGALGLSTTGPYLSEKKRRNPLFLPDYEVYPA